MSRIILTRYGNGEEHIVVGWDNPTNTFFWQEFNKEPDPDPETGEVNWDGHDGWEEVLRQGGFGGGLPTWDSFMKSLPDEFHKLITERVKSTMLQHQYGMHNGKQADISRVMVDLTQGESNVVQG